MGPGNGEGTWYVTIKLRCACERNSAGTSERARVRERERERGETKCANKANMRADLQPGGQRYFHEFLEIVGINFPPLFTDGFVSSRDSFPHLPCVRSLTPDL